MMAAVKHVREKLLEAGDWQKYPTWFKKVLARRLLLMLIPSELSRSLPRWLSAPIFGDNAIYPADFPWPDWMVIPPDFDWPDWWTPWMMLEFDKGVTPENAFPLDWKPGDPLPPGVTITTGYPFPPGWTSGDPLPAGVTLGPGASFPPGWAVGDLMPPGVTLEPTYTLPPDWTPNVPIPPDVDVTNPKTWPPDWTPQHIPVYWIFPDPQIDNPEPETAIPPTLPDIFDPKPKPKTEKGVLPSITIHVPETDWREFYRSVVGEDWATCHDNTNASASFKSDYEAWVARCGKATATLHWIGRAIHKFTLPPIPSGATFEAGILRLWRAGTHTCNIIAQATNITDILLFSNYSSMSGEPTEVTQWIGGNPVIYLNADIVAYINAHKGGNIYLMTREYDHDYLNDSPATGQKFRGLYYTPSESGTDPDLVLRYRR